MEAPSDLFPEYYLIKVPKFNDEITDTLDEWIFFLKNEEIKEGFKAKGLQAARKKLDILKMSTEERRSYEAYLENLRYHASMMLGTYQEGKVEGLDEGLDKGTLIGKIQIIREMRGLPATDEQELRSTTVDNLEHMLQQLKQE